MVPINQYIVYGSDTTLNCSYNDPRVEAIPTVIKEDDDEILDDKRITTANLDDEGVYVCDIFVLGHQASIRRSFNVHVIGKMTALSLSLSFSLPLSCPPPPLSLPPSLPPSSIFNFHYTLHY